MSSRIDDGLADAGAAEQADLAALHVRRKQVDDLNTGLENLRLGHEVDEFRGLAVDREMLVGLDLRLAVLRLAEDVHQPAEAGLADGDGDRGAGVLDGSAAGQTLGRAHRDRAHDVVAEVARDLDGQRRRGAAVAFRGPS